MRRTPRLAEIYIIALHNLNLPPFWGALINLEQSPNGRWGPRPRASEPSVPMTEFISPALDPFHVANGVQKKREQKEVLFFFQHFFSSPALHSPILKKNSVTISRFYSPSQARERGGQRQIFAGSIWAKKERKMTPPGPLCWISL